MLTMKGILFKIVQEKREEEDDDEEEEERGFIKIILGNKQNYCWKI